jgi:uncharacterized OB-fold protein
MTGQPTRPGGAAPGYLRAIDPLPLEAPDANKLAAFYEHLADGRLTTTRCRACGRTDWPPRGFCPACTADAFDWVDLPRAGTVHGFSVQETGVPAGFARPLVFAIVKVDGLRIFAPLVEVADPGRLLIGMPVAFHPVRVADDPQGRPRYLPAFRPA